MSKLVIVESPAKAKTIASFLGRGYEVLASFGHVRDLPERADDIPADKKKEKWAKLGVNVENDFEPLYIVPDDKKRHVDQLKKASKGVEEILLATDEDREGESISWHILQLLKPAKSVRVRRIVFHELTPEAITEAVRTPRDIDENLVRAQETRRILDRLYGYTLSPLLWKKVAPKLSAGRVQSVAVRLIVLRERQRASFVQSEYWDLEALLGAPGGTFKARLNRVGKQGVASGRHFDPDTGLLKDPAVVHLREGEAKQLARSARESRPWTVTRLDTTPGTEKPPVPFMTSTLQQEANRKLRYPSRRTMQIAQALYEGVDLGGERVGLITYMRTDSLNLAERALKEAREVIMDLYGAEYLPKEPVRYKTKAKGAQEAHEAIRPTDLARRPEDVRARLTPEQFALYDLIWKRTIACQMKPAEVLRTTVEVTVETDGQPLQFGASGKQIIFPGFLKAYVEGSDDPDAELETRETVLPPMKQGMELRAEKVDAQGHTTQPPARYTEASLVKKLEEEGIGRPSTYASIIGTIQDRGYVFKRANELVPTFTAYAVTELLERNFEELVDLAFTAKMENQLDDIAEGDRGWVEHLREFYFGKTPEQGLVHQVEAKAADMPYPNIPIGEDPDSKLPIVIKVGRFGPFLQRGEGGPGNTANVPDDIAPADLTIDQALAMIRQKVDGPQSLGTHSSTGKAIYHRSGRYGDYLELEQTEEERASDQKPRRVTLPDKMKPGDLGQEDFDMLFSLPRTLGNNDDGEEVTASIGRYGPYLKAGTSTRNLPDWRTAASIRLKEALEILAQPKVGGRSTGGTPIAALKEFGQLEGSEGAVRVMAGRFGPYVTDGTTNATLPKGLDPTQLTAEQAVELLAAKRALGPAKKRSARSSARGRATGAKKSTGTKKTTTRRKS